MLSTNHWGIRLILASVLFAAGSSGAVAIEPGAPARLIDKAYVTLIAVRKELDGPAATELSISKNSVKDLQSYYGTENANLVWVNSEGLDEKAKNSLQTAFERAESYGLRSADYDIPATGSGNAASELAKTELRMSLAALKYATQAQTGRFTPSSLNSEFIDLKPVRPNAGNVLADLAASGDKLADHLESYNPPHEQFKALRQKLQEIRTATKSGTVRTRIPDGPSLGSNTYHPHIAIVRERLSVAPPTDVERKNAVQYYDETLEAAVRAYQEEKGLKPDGVIGRRTREALNEGTIPVSAEKIISNMERWRWAPRDLGKRYVFVNIPEFQFRVVSGKTIIHQERIVTGSPKHRTPIFSDEMETIVFNPYWNVPRSILVNEIIPAVRSNPGYVDRNNMEIIWQGGRSVDAYMVDWEQVNPNKLFLRQLPGGGNALGRVKFLFPNKHSVYMHDTPSKHLFSNPVRAYSHGCVRVRNPLKFAELLLADQGWSKNRVDSALAGGYDQHVRLEHKLPVHVSYFTAWVDEDSQIHGYRDVYGYDEQVRVALKLDTSTKKYAAKSVEEEFEVGERGLQN